MQIILPRYPHRITEDDLANPTLAQNFTWKGRTEYLTWVATWKAMLHEKIAEIRRLKAIRRDKSRSDEERGIANTKRQMLRIDCFNLLMLRTEGKRLSSAQRQQLKFEPQN